MEVVPLLQLSRITKSRFTASPEFNRGVDEVCRIGSTKTVYVSEQFSGNSVKVFILLGGPWEGQQGNESGI
jgi:hypothetical protein